MAAIIAFIVRLVGYALVVGVPARIAEYFWQRAALDQAEALQSPHVIGTAIVLVAPFILALFGYGLFRRAAVFIALYIAGAALTAPFAFARFATPGG